jgi:hypothetical protein
MKDFYTTKAIKEYGTVQCPECNTKFEVEKHRRYCPKLICHTNAKGKNRGIQNKMEEDSIEVFKKVFGWVIQQQNLLRQGYLLGPFSIDKLIEELDYTHAPPETYIQTSIELLICKGYITRLNASFYLNDPETEKEDPEKTKNVDRRRSLHLVNENIEVCDLYTTFEKGKFKGCFKCLLSEDEFKVYKPEGNIE